MLKRPVPEIREPFRPDGAGLHPAFDAIALDQPTALRFDPRNDLFAEYLPAFFLRTVIARRPVVHDIIASMITLRGSDAGLCHFGSRSAQRRGFRGLSHHRGQDDLEIWRPLFGPRRRCKRGRRRAAAENYHRRRISDDGTFARMVRLTGIRRGVESAPDRPGPAADLR